MERQFLVLFLSLIAAFPDLVKATCKTHCLICEICLKLKYFQRALSKRPVSTANACSWLIALRFWTSTQSWKRCRRFVTKNTAQFVVLWKPRPRQRRKQQRNLQSELAREVRIWFCWHGDNFDNFRMPGVFAVQLFELHRPKRRSWWISFWKAKGRLRA